MNKQSFFVSGLVLLIGLSHAHKAVANMASNELLPAQASQPLAAFSSPEAVQGQTTLKINSPASLSRINTLLEQGFEGRFSGASVEINYSSNDAALAALQQGRIDLAAIDRPLTDEEKSQNLVAVPLSRQNIAVVVGADNPFAADLKVEQFIKILHGEIIDWAELGGTPAPIRVIAQSPYHPARQALQRYSIFRNTFSQDVQTGNTQTVQLPDDRTQSMIEALGRDGISFAIADQVIDQPKVRILSMHGTLPGDSDYPFSSPLAYVYQGTATPAVQAYLDYATTSEMRQALKTKVQAIASQPGASQPYASQPSASQPGASQSSVRHLEAVTEAKPGGTLALYSGTYRTKKTASIPLLWWHWLVFTPVAGIFLWSLFNNSQGETDEADS